MNERVVLGFSKTAAVMWRSFSFMGKKRLQYAAGSIFTFAEMGMVYLLPFTVSLLTTMVTEGMSLKTGYRFLGVFLLFLVLAPLVCLGEYWSKLASYHGVVSLKKRLFSHMQRLSVQERSSFSKGEWIRILNQDAEEVGAIFSGYAIKGLYRFIVYEVLGVLLLFQFHWIYAVLALLLCIIGLSFSLIINPRVRGLERYANQKRGQLIGWIDEAITAMAEIKLFGMGKALEQRYGEAASQVKEVKISFRALNGFSYAVVDLLGNAGIPVAFMILLLSYRGEWFPVSQAVFIASIFGIMFQGTKEFNAFIQYIQVGLVAAMRVFEVLDMPLEETGKNSTEDSDQNREDKKQSGGRGQSAEITFDKVIFSYPSNHNSGDENTGKAPVLQGIAFTLGAGEKIALVGSSGSGKSTILKLLLGFYDSWQGEIWINGSSLKEMSKEEIRKWFAYVPQETFLLDGSVRENIIFGQESYEEREMEEAAKKAGIHEVIRGLPMGYDTLLGKGGRELSGGERQRIGLARALLKNAPVLLLDEVSSALDADTEEKVIRQLLASGAEKTICMVTHRLTAVSEVDRILYLEEGRIKEVGSHDELMERNGGYAYLYRCMVEENV